MSPTKVAEFHMPVAIWYDPEYDGSEYELPVGAEYEPPEYDGSEYELPEYERPE
jgi:hypothetical protein